MHQHESDKDCQINRLIYFRCYFQESLSKVTSMLVTDVGDKMCWCCHQHILFSLHQLRVTIFKMFKHIQIVKELVTEIIGYNLIQGYIKHIF